MPDTRPEPGSESWRATLLRLSESPEKADVASLVAIVRANPARADALFALSLALTRADRAAAAAEALRRARFLDPALPKDICAEGLREALRVRLSDPIRAPEVEPAPSQDPVLLPVLIPNPAPQRESESAPLRCASEVEPTHSLPDGLIVAQRSLDLYLRHIVRWAAPLALVNLGACLVNPGGSILSQALPWSLALAVAAPITLKAMASEWAPRAPGLASWPRFGSGQLWAGFLLLATAFAGLVPSTVLRWFQGADSIAFGLLIWLPLLGLLAPALMILVTHEGDVVERPPALSLLLERGPLHMAVVTLVGSLGVMVLAALGWGFLELMQIADEPARRLLFGVGASLPQSLVLALVACCGREALVWHRDVEGFAYES